MLCTFTRLLLLEALLIEKYLLNLLNMEPFFYVDQTSLKVTDLEVRYRIDELDELEHTLLELSCNAIKA